MPERLDGSRLLLALGALVLLVSLFLDWFKPGLSAWTVFEIVDLLLAGVAVAALLAVAADAAPRAGLPRVPPGILPIAALAPLVLIVAALLNHPPAAVGRSPETGIWIGLAGAALMALGAFLGAGRISVVITRRGTAGRRPRREMAPPAAPADPTQPLGFEDRPDAETQTRPLPPERR